MEMPLRSKVKQTSLVGGGWDVRGAHVSPPKTDGERIDLSVLAGSNP